MAGSLHRLFIKCNLAAIFAGIKITIRICKVAVSALIGFIIDQYIAIIRTVNHIDFTLDNLSGFATESEWNFPLDG